MEQDRAPDIRIAEIARRQHGAVTIAQLHAAGLGDSAVLKRRQTGRLHRLHRGIYAVGHMAASTERRWMAAVLALSGAPTGSNPAAVLSHRSAAALWGMLLPVDGPVDVSLPSRGGRRKRKGIHVHRPLSLETGETTYKDGIPVTSPARTIRDLRSVVPGRELRRAAREADFLGLPIGPDVTTERTRSELERRFLWLCGRHHLPKPAVNMRIGAMTVDFCWMERRLIVETDGYQGHGGRTAFENDRARDLRLHSLGYEVHRLSYRQVFDEPQRVVETLRAGLIPVGGARS